MKHPRQKNKHKYWDVPEWQAKIKREDEHGINCLILILFTNCIVRLVERLTIMNAPYKPRHRPNKIIPTITHEDSPSINADGVLKKGIIKAFLHEMTIDAHDASFS